MKKQVMTRAWEIAREAVKRFGGNVSEYIAESMRMAWAEAKEVTTRTANKAEIKVVRAWVAHFFPNLSNLLESQITKGGATVKIYSDRVELMIGNIDVEVTSGANREMVMNLWYCGMPFAEVA